MAYVEPSTFEHKDVVLIYVAGSTSEAKTVEAVLSESEVDYTLASEPFLRIGLLSASELPGVGFYVVSGQASFSRTLLGSRGLTAGVIPEAGE